MKEFHFYARQDVIPKGIHPITTFDETYSEILDNGIDRVDTTQMACLTDAWHKYWEEGARIFIHDETGVFQVSNPCTRTMRDLKEGHNISKMWRSGEFLYEVKILDSKYNIE